MRSTLERSVSCSFLAFAFYIISLLKKKEKVLFPFLILKYITGLKYALILFIFLTHGVIESDCGSAVSSPGIDRCVLTSVRATFCCSHLVVALVSRIKKNKKVNACWCGCTFLSSWIH